jgi:glucan phosphoethanolaminetransferase (alkaline phosphatase superfamily)
MSLYGYDRDTTPNELFEKQNMLLFNNAISPAPLTLISIPLILSNAMPDDYSYSSPKYTDNIISLADYLNFDTYWLTTQKSPGQDVSLISVFENYSNHFEQIDGVYDEKILPPFYEILKYKKRKLIILHINGSHMSYCDKYPSTEDYFKGKPNNIDCYDNSIRYTDKVLGSIFKKLKTEKAALVYVSDHGTSLVNGKMTFSNTKDQTNVPLYIWYSPKLLKDNKVKLGVVNQLTQTTIVYSLISNLLGVSNSEIENLKYTNNLRFVNSDLTVSDYEDLKNNN